MKYFAKIALVIFLFLTLGFAKYSILFTKIYFKEKKNKELSIFFTQIEFQKISQQTEFEDQEFILDGSYYDIEKVIPSKGGFLIVCEKDNLETEFLNYVENIFQTIKKLYSEVCESLELDFMALIINNYTYLVPLLFLISVLHSSKYFFLNKPFFASFIEIPPEQ